MREIHKKLLRESSERLREAITVLRSESILERIKQQCGVFEFFGYGDSSRYGKDQFAFLNARNKSGVSKILCENCVLIIF